MLLLPETKIDLIVSNRRVIMLVGLVMMVVPLMLGFGFGVLSGFTLFSLGANCNFFRTWRSEPGVWMIAILLAVTLGPCWAYFEFLHLLAVFAPAANRAVGLVGWNQIRLSVDAAVALLIFAENMKLVVTVAIENWIRTRRLLRSERE